MLIVGQRLENAFINGLFVCFLKKEGGVSHSGRGSKSHFDVAGTDFTFCYKLEPDGVLGCRCHHVSLSFD